MIRKIVADTPLNDVNDGSALMTLLEAAAQTDFENNAAILSVLELLSIDATRNVDLDARGADFGLTRTAAQRGTGLVTIGDSSITKRSTGLYQVKLPPISGSTTIFVNDASAWDATGSLFIGRDTAQFEGPISYSVAPIDQGSFWEIQLDSALQKDHLISDIVVDAQGTADRLVPANTIVIVPANNINPEIQYKILRDAVIPSGEDSVANTAIISVDAGSNSNAGINTITQFTSLPFATATVTNTSAITDANDVETDEEFRERIKAFTSTLARGTKLAILSAIIGISDTSDNKQVASATITEPPKVGDPSILYIDDGSGFQPTFEGQSVDVLIKEATGTEEFLQLANFPLPRPQVINTVDGPFEITANSQLTVIVDGVDEVVTFTDSQFLNPASATLAELIIATNDQSSLFKMRFHEDSARLLIEPVAHDAETIQVAALSSIDSELLYANSSLKFPTNEFSHIKLYQNNILLREKEKAATLISNTFNTWNVIADENITISVDGTPSQFHLFTSADFGGVPYPALELADWVTAFNATFAGITATATATDAMQIVSNQEGTNSALEALSGGLLEKMFANQSTSAVGQSSDFELNRQNGNLRILTTVAVDDSITAGSEDTKGQVLSTETITGSYGVATDGSSRPSEIVVMVDPTDVVVRTGLGISVGTQFEITINGSNEMRIMADTASAFSKVTAGDFIFITSRGAASSWIDPANAGIFKVVAKGGHTQTPLGFPSGGGDDTYIDVRNINAVTGVHAVEAIEDIQVFKSDHYPQLWQGLLTTTPASAPIQDIVDTFNDNILNAKASIFKTNAIKITSTTEADGSIAIPVSVANATGLFTTAGTEQFGNESHVANRTASQDVSSFFKRTPPTATDQDGVAGKPVFLDRYSYTDIKGQLTADAEPSVLVPGSPNEILESAGSFIDSILEYDDIVTMVNGQNKELYRSIREFLPGDTLGTQQTLPRTVMDYYTTDEWTAFRPLSINAADSIVFIMDQDSVAKTIDIPMSRTGQINNIVPPTDFSFSANDVDNEAGITFGTLQVWSKTTNSTEFSDYAIWMRARNWYESGGAGTGGGSFMVRAVEYGPHGENYRFRIEYPEIANAVNTISHITSTDFTLNTYAFGSDVDKPTGIAAGDSIAVSSPSANNFKYTFPGTVDFSAVIPGDIMSIAADAGLSTANSGVFSIAAVDDVLKTIDIYNPNGVITVVGTPGQETIAAVDDIVGSKTVSNVTVLADVAGASDSTFFVLEDNAGTVAIWYRVTDGANTPNPGAGALGVNRVLEIPILTGATAIAIAASTSGILTVDSQFTAAAGGTDTITITNTVNGAFAASVDGGTATGYGFAGVVGTADITVDGTYFIVPDGTGAADSVAIWYDLTGLTPEPLHGASRSIEITTVVAGDNAATIATKTAVFLAGDGAWASAVAGAGIITLTNAFNGAVSAIGDGTSGFTTAISVVGTPDVLETIALPLSFSIYALTGTAVADIIAKINESDLIVAAEIDGTNPITLATREEVYTPAVVGDYADALSFEHDPDPISAVNGYIGLYDSIDWVKDYENLDPHFALKRGLQLQGVPPTATYSLETTPNEDATTGEYFKLVPVTLTNMLHHFTHKALSQLPIVADIDITNNIRRIQIKSEQLGSAGAVEVVGGNANGISFSIFGEGQTATGLVDDRLLVKTAAFPVTLTSGDYVLVENDISTTRQSRLQLTDTLDVSVSAGDVATYAWNPKATFINQFVSFSITDVSATYFRPAGTIWRWTHNDAGSVLRITDLTLGAIGTPPDDQLENDAGDAPALEILSPFAGSATEFQTFDITVNAFPNQADYFTFESNDGNLFAIWFSVDGDLTVPTGPLFAAVPAANQIRADIFTAGPDTLNQIVFAVSTALSANIPFLLSFSREQLSGATFLPVVPGDILMADGMATTAVANEWKNGNLRRLNGSNNISGFPIIAVDAGSSYVDVLNPAGQPLVDQVVGAGAVTVCPTPAIEWVTRHSAKVEIDTIAVDGASNAVCVTFTPHGYNPGDIIDINDNLGEPSTNAIVLTVTNEQTFTFTSTIVGPIVVENGSTILTAATPTLYKIEGLGFNNLYRLSAVGGDLPGFTDCGIAVDDRMVISGTTFASNNAGNFRVLGVDPNSIIFQNTVGSEELNRIIPFNNLSIQPNWTSNLDIVTGVAGTFLNLSLGDWVKKPEDDDDKFLQVIAFLDAGNAVTTSDLAVQIQLGGVYGGTTSTSSGVSFDQAVDYEAGVELQDEGDIKFYNVDSVEVGDSLFIDNISNADWFSTSNSGTYTITGFGIDNTLRPTVSISNGAGVAETGIDAGISLIGFSIIEGEDAKFQSIRKVEHLSIDELNADRRRIFLSPPTQVRKFSEANETKLTTIGKLGYSTDITTGVDGYKYYTGLLRTVQRIVDGFEPDQASFPGRRAVGGAIEILPPLIKRIDISVDVTTNEGVNLNEISNDIKSAVIDYVNNRGVGEDVILADIIVRIMDITGVAAVTFNTPTPDTERIAIADNEKPFIEPTDISVA